MAIGDHGGGGLGGGAELGLVIIGIVFAEEGGQFEKGKWDLGHALVGWEVRWGYVVKLMSFGP